MIHPLVSVLPHIFLVYAIIFAITGIHFLAVIIVLSLTIGLCIYKLPKSAQADSDEVLQIGSTPIIAHRGAGHDAPENTLAAIKLAKQNGADAIEFDVDYTSDGIPVVIHDSTVDRTTDGTGNVNHMPFEKIRRLKASVHHWQKERFPNEQVPTLAEVITLCLELGLKMYIDVKGNALRTAEVMGDLFRKHPELYKNALVCSFFPWIVYLVKRQDPKITTGLTYRSRFLSHNADGTERDGPLWQRLVAPIADTILRWAQYGWLWYLCGNSVFLMFSGDCCQQRVNHFRARGISVVVWTVNLPLEKKYLKEVIECPYMTDRLSLEGNNVIKTH